MNGQLISQSRGQIDYNTYEKLLQKINSVKLENIRDLQANEPMTFEYSCRKKMSSYYAKLAQILEESSEEV